KASALQPDNSDILFELGVLLSWTGAYDESIQYFNTILKAIPDHYDAQLSLARVLSWQGNYDRALALCDSVIAQKFLYTDAYMIKARIYTWNSDFNNAKKAYRELLAVQPDNTQARIGLISIIAAQGNHNAARSEYQDMLKKNPDNPVLLRELGKVLSWQGEYEKAKKYLQKSLDLNPHDEQTQASLTRVFRWAGAYQEGIEFQKKILSQDPNNVPAMQEIGLLYDMDGQYNNAIHWYEKAQFHEPDNPQLSARLGLLYSRAERLDDSIKALQRALNVYDNNVESLITLGRVYSWKLRIADAISLYRKALDLDPNNQDAYIGLGRTYFYDDRWELAEEQFRKALDINPLNREAYRELMKMKSLRLPHYTTRFDYFRFKNYDKDTGSITEETFHYELMQIAEMTFSPGFSLGIQYKYLRERERDQDHMNNYRLKATEYAVFGAKKINDHISCTAKLIQGSYADNDSRFYPVKRNNAMITGFGLLQYEYNRWSIITSYAREPLYPVVRDGMVAVLDYKEMGISLRHETTQNISMLAYQFTEMYYDHRERKEYGLGLDYTLPYCRSVDIGYEYSSKTNPSDTGHNVSTSFRNSLKNFEYLLSYHINRGSFNNTNTHIVDALTTLTVIDRVQIHGDITMEKERGSDRDGLLQTKIYITFFF
ncbi:MAG: tetratricopeptide repeat protein, partial [Elusimicrobia bacterium]|nr:tetratricopeptide repeat protein [Elusimicrobiota bacterium]MBD3412693.1 tetratricopeptide repeat protein [Elusimicrobiota bacterium]